MSDQTYIAGTAEYRYPAAGDPTPPGGAKVLLLTEGGVCVVGSWSNNGGFRAWSPLPKRNKLKESQCQPAASAS